MSGIGIGEVSESKAGRTNIKRDRFIPIKPEIAGKYLVSFASQVGPSKTTTVSCYFCQEEGDVTPAYLVPFAEILRLQALSDGRSPESPELAPVPDTQRGGHAYLCARGHVTGEERYKQEKQSAGK